MLQVSKHEAQNIADGLNLDYEAFATNYLQVVVLKCSVPIAAGQWAAGVCQHHCRNYYSCMLQPGALAANASRLSLKKNNADTACVFLQGNKCAVYEHRPTQVSSTIVYQIVSPPITPIMTTLQCIDVASRTCPSAAMHAVPHLPLLARAFDFTA